ncbi:MAG: hypothetical protein HRU38_02550 [Saccharospirillaceae bacterium]|nr:esterase family protein [Pseudomonadales bacterium]NRB77541.1 hypothetical protein [Saccharospirillaceae bacterium]
MLKIQQTFTALLVIIALSVSSLSMAVNKKIKKIKIDAPSLVGSILENNSKQKIEVHLPPSYYESNKSFPVIYYFHGYGATVSEVKRLAGFRYKEMVKDGEVKEMIIVGINGRNEFGGSFFVNSPVTGNWEDFVVNDVVPFMDKTFRTIKKPSQRGLAGFSMGGFSAINIGFNHPDIFKHVFALSPGLFDLNGMDNAAKMWDLHDEKIFMQGYAAAFAPNVDGKDGIYWHEWDNTNKDIVKLWEAGFGDIDAKIQRYKAKSEQLDSIYVEWGNKDFYGWIVDGSQYFVEQLKANEIKVTSFDHEGNHIINSLVAADMTKFFSEAFPASE